MSNSGEETWLQVLEQRSKWPREAVRFMLRVDNSRVINQVNIDIDWMDPELIKSLPFKPHDSTSNQLWMGIQLQHVSNAKTLSDVALEAGSDWVSAYAKMGALLCQKNLDSIQGRVLVQTLPSFAHDLEKTLAHARSYDREFQKLGIPRSRYCIKILATGAGVNAARILQQEGIDTLGTGIFSVEQAIACSQAGCLYISPYYNEVRTHEDPSLWPDVADPAVQHPFSHRIYQILHVYRQLYQSTGRRQPLVKNAAFRSLKEVVATAELGCHSATISPAMWKELSSTPYDKAQDPGSNYVKSEDPYKDSRLNARLQRLLNSDPLRNSTEEFKLPSTDTDYLVDNGAELEKALDRDPAGKNRLLDAIALFTRAEEASQALIEGQNKHSSL